MLNWADALVRMGRDMGADAELAQRTARETWLWAANTYPEAPPRPGEILTAHARMVARALEGLHHRRVPLYPRELPWMRRLTPAEREGLWLVWYTDRPWELVAAENLTTREAVQEAVQRAWGLGSVGTLWPPRSESQWREWLDDLHPDDGGRQASFDWQQWNPAARRRPPRGIAWRSLALVAVVLAAVGAAVVLVLGQQPTTPPTPFPLPARPQAERLMVVAGPRLKHVQFGARPGAPVRGHIVAGGVAWYPLDTLSRGAPASGYRLGRLTFALVPGPHSVALIIFGGEAGRVSLLSAGGKLLRPFARNSRYTVYQTPGQAATVRWAGDGQAVEMAWAPNHAPRRSVTFTGAVWATAPRVRGFDGTYVVAAPPTGRAVVPLAMLASGLLAQVGSGQYWLLPNRGPAMPLFSVHTAFAGEAPLLAAAPYPGTSNELLISGPAGSGLRWWWNLASDEWGITNISGHDAVEATLYGWVSAAFGHDAVYSYQSPPVSYYMAQNLSGSLAWDHRVLVQRRGPGTIGVYNWRTRRFAPVRVAPAAGAGMVAFPGWGPTYLEGGALSPRRGGTSTTEEQYVGPGVIRLVPADGRQPAVLTLTRQEDLIVANQWLVLVSPTLATNVVQVGWPAADGHLLWHRLVGPANSRVTVTATAVYWTTPTGVYVWLPAFARP